MRASVLEHYECGELKFCAALWQAPGRYVVLAESAGTDSEVLGSWAMA